MTTAPASAAPAASADSATSAAKITAIRTYFERLTASDMPGVLALFAPGATVTSPYLGTLPATAFFASLDQASAQNRLTVFDVLLGEKGDSGAAHFEYDWTLASGDRIVFEGVDYFRFTAAADADADAGDGAGAGNGAGAGDGAGETRFTSLSIFYDTHPAREQVGDKYQRS